MKLLANKFICFYIVAFPIALEYSVSRCATIYDGLSPTLADEYLWCGYFPKDIVIVLSAMLFMNLLKEYHRVAVLIRYKSKLKLVLMQFRTVIISAALTSIYYVAIVTIMALRIVPYKCNWETFESMSMAFIGRPVENHFESYQYGLLLLYTTFFTIVMVGVIMILFWWLLETPVAGLVVNIVLMVLEVVGMEPSAYIYYSIVDISIRVYGHGIDTRMFKLPFIYIPILVAITVIVMRRKDYLKLK